MAGSGRHRYREREEVRVLVGLDCGAALERLDKVLEVVVHLVAQLVLAARHVCHDVVVDASAIEATQHEAVGSRVAEAQQEPPLLPLHQTESVT